MVGKIQNSKTISNTIYIKSDFPIDGQINTIDNQMYTNNVIKFNIPFIWKPGWISCVYFFNQNLFGFINKMVSEVDMSKKMSDFTEQNF